MAQTNNIRLDEDPKKQSDAFCSDVDISAESDPFYSPSNMARLRKSIAQMEATGGTVHEVSL